jgi:hypothetical protein
MYMFPEENGILKEKGVDGMANLTSQQVLASTQREEERRITKC